MNFIKQFMGIDTVEKDIENQERKLFLIQEDMVKGYQKTTGVLAEMLRWRKATVKEIKRIKTTIEQLHKDVISLRMELEYLKNELHSKDIGSNKNDAV